MLLKRFNYYYSVTGDEGGLLSLSFEFCPTARGGGKPARKQLKELIRDDFSGIEALLDEVLLSGDKNLGFEKLPTLEDSVAASTVGFQYAAKNFSAGRATVAYSLEKIEPRAIVVLKLQLGHHVNLAVFDKVMAFPDLRIGDDAQNTIQQMKAVLAAREQKRTGPMQFLENAKI